MAETTDKDPQSLNPNPEASNPPKTYTRGELLSILLSQKDLKQLVENSTASKSQDSTKSLNLSRRNFLTGSAIVGGTLALSAWRNHLLKNPLSYSEPKPNSNQLSRPAEATSTPEPTSTPETSPSLMTEIALTRLEDEAAKRRAIRSQENPTEYNHRIDTELNKNRINIVMFGYGEMRWYEAGGAEATQPFRGSHSILSIDTRSGRVDVITPTGQTLAPEVRKYQLDHDQPNAKFDWIDKSYNTGGFDLQRRVIEDMTGLSVDFQVVLQDSTIASLVDKVFQGLKMDVPLDIETMPFVLDGKEYPGGNFLKGPTTLTGLRTVQYIKALAKSFVEGKWILNAEPNPRKHQVFRAMMTDFDEDKYNPAFWYRLKGFLDQNLAQQKLVCDFDISDMIKAALSPTSAFSILGKIKDGQNLPNQLTIGQTIYMQDPGTGADGGVSWIQSTQSPYIKKAVSEGLIADPHDSVPFTTNANPFSDNLTDDYWLSVRQLVKKDLTS